MEGEREAKNTCSGGGVLQPLILAAEEERAEVSSRADCVTCLLLSFRVSGLNV